MTTKGTVAGQVYMLLKVQTMGDYIIYGTWAAGTCSGNCMEVMVIYQKRDIKG